MSTNDLGSKISIYRQNMNMTQEELALRLGVTPQAVSKWERSQSFPDLTIFTNLCQILHISADTLLDISLESGSDANNISTDVLRHLRNSLPALELTFGKKLVPVFTTSPFTELVQKERIRLAKEGFLLPVIRIYDDISLEEDEYRILSYTKVLLSEHINEQDASTCSYIIRMLADTAKKYYANILNYDIVKQLTDNLRTSSPALIDGIVPDKISYGLLLEIFREFIRSGNSPRYLPKIIELLDIALRDYPDYSSKELTEHVTAKFLSNY